MAKQIIKEWLYQMLSKDLVVVKNPGSYNSQVGVPLSVWQIQPQHQLGIFEAGISRPGEMEKLETVIQPTIGLFTNIGSSHSEGFKNQEEKIDEKLKLFKDAEVLIYCRDHETLHSRITASKIKTFSWGTNQPADVQITYQGDICFIRHNNEELPLHLPFSDKASQENCLHCVARVAKDGVWFVKDTGKGKWFAICAHANGAEGKYKSMPAN